MNHNSFDWINHLDLSPHPEGGYFKEIYRNKTEISGKNLPGNYSGNRNLATSIYFLLDKDQVSKLHRLASDEIWYFHAGSSVIVHVFYNGNYTLHTLGDNHRNNEQLQVILPAGSIFGAEVADKNSFGLFGCMVAPGFHFDDFDLIQGDNLINLYPMQNDLILRLT
jgi:uncharacterized protein